MTKPANDDGTGAQGSAPAKQTDRTREHQWDKQGAGQRASGEAEPARDPATDGKHRLSETRQQHDPAEKESEIGKSEER